MSENGNGNGNGFHVNGNGNHRGRGWSFWKRRSANPQTDPFRRLALQLHYDSVDGRQPRSVLVTTPDRSDVCDRASVGLACSLAAELNRPVALVDASSGPRSATELMRSSPSAGLSDLLTNAAISLNEISVPTTHDNLVLVPGGTALVRCPESSAISSAVARLSDHFDFTVIAGGGTLTDSLTRALAPHVGCVLLLGVENETIIDDLDAAQNALSLGNARKVALVLTTRGD